MPIKWNCETINQIKFILRWKKWDKKWALIMMNGVIHWELKIQALKSIKQFTEKFRSKVSMITDS